MPEEEFEPTRDGRGRREEDQCAPPCEKVVILSTEVPKLSKIVTVLDTKMGIGIALLSLIAVLLTTQSLYQIPALKEIMNRQDAVTDQSVVKINGELNALRGEVGALSQTVDTLVGAAYVLRSDITQSRKTETRNAAAIKKNTDERNRPKNMFGK